MCCKFTYSKKCVMYSGKFVAQLGHVPLNISKSACQRCTNLPKIYNSPENSGSQKGVMKQVPLYGPKNIRKHHKKFCPHDDLVPRICTSLLYVNRQRKQTIANKLHLLSTINCKPEKHSARV